HWNYWYGTDGPPPPVTWRLRDGGHGLAGFAARWDADPGVAAGRTLATSGSAALPGPGAHTLHLRVFDRAGTSADITYLYLYDVQPPTSALRVGPGSSTALGVHWSGTDDLSGLKDMAIEVAAGSGAFRPWPSLQQGRAVLYASPPSSCCLDDTSPRPPRPRPHPPPPAPLPLPPPAPSRGRPAPPHGAARRRRAPPPPSQRPHLSAPFPF